MPRPHTEFIHAQDLDWRTGVWPGALSGVGCKILSEDTATGACSTVLQYPAGWAQKDALHFGADHEFLVLDGSISINGQDYPFDSYGYLPAGFTHDNWHTDGGAVVLSFFSGTPEATPGPGNTTSDAIPYLYLHDMKWTTADVDPDLDFLRIAHKVLRKDEDSGETTLLLNCGAQSHPEGWTEAALAHPCVEEMFLLSGDIIAERGIMHAGCYFWRPANIWHGPFGSRNGNVCLIRFMEGHHVNNWGDEKLPFSLTPDYNPDLPDHFSHLANKPFSPPTPY